MTAAYKFQGNTDSVTACDCCGRSSLKSTVHLLEVESGADVFFGVTCAARAMNLEVKEIRAGAKRADEENHRREVAEAAAHRAAENVRWIAHLTARTGGIVDASGRPDVFRMIQKLGGMTAAEVGFSG